MAAVNVDPLKLVIPDKFLNDPQTRFFFQNWLKITSDLRKRTGGDTDKVDQKENDAVSNTSAQLFNLIERIGSGDPLTSDETGFTVDSIKLTVDMTEA